MPSMANFLVNMLAVGPADVVARKLRCDTSRVNEPLVRLHTAQRAWCLKRPNSLAIPTGSCSFDCR